jgi:tRNASer (uridine44-2'-O)-methyltransferase
MALALARPRFNPSPCSSDVDPPPLSGSTNVTWTPIITCPADFPAPLVRLFLILIVPALTPPQFEHAISQLVHHPEYNSTLILRSEIIQDTIAPPFPDIVPALQGLQPVRNIHRRLLPRRPTRDAALEQHCTLYAPSSSHPTEAEAEIAALVLTPILSPEGGGGVLPYYHPTVTHLAFRFVAPTTTTTTTTTSSPAAALRIEAVPHAGTSLDPGARLYRTCLSLLETLHRYGWGALTHYKKRVAHDVLVPRETYQDLYLVMRERHKRLVDDWREVTDPLKHVFEVRPRSSPRPCRHS